MTNEIKGIGYKLGKKSLRVNGLRRRSPVAKEKSRKRRTLKKSHKEKREEREPAKVPFKLAV